VPRPLNSYVNNNLVIFHCPKDIKPYSDSGGTYASKYEGVGNSYAFNWYLRNTKITAIPVPSSLILFTEAPAAEGRLMRYSWHGDKVNVCFLDGHLKFLYVPEQGDSDPLWWHGRSAAPDSVN
jgi:prepilin-type processing-associated H-X9-DG protein